MSQSSHINWLFPRLPLVASDPPEGLTGNCSRLWIHAIPDADDADIMLNANCIFLCGYSAGVLLLLVLLLGDNGLCTLTA